MERTAWLASMVCRVARLSCGGMAAADPVTTVEILVPFSSALAGALVGGFASAYGSWRVKRREIRHAQRIRMFDELLPELHGQLDTVRNAHTGGFPGSYDAAHPPSADLLQRLSRSAKIAGRSERERADALRTLLASTAPGRRVPGASDGSAR